MAVPLNYYLLDNPTGELLCAHSSPLYRGIVPKCCMSTDMKCAMICGDDNAIGKLVIV